MKTITRLLIKAISSVSVDIEKEYQKQRKMYEIIHLDYLKFLGKTVDANVALEDREIPIRIFYPKEEGEGLLIFFHGGGWVYGNVESYHKTCRTLAKETNQIVISVEYRLAPEYPFPLGLEDCYEVTKKFFTETDILQVPSSKITLIGDSAGGNLAASVSLLARDRGEFKVEKQILLYPVTHNNHTESSPFPSISTKGEDYLLTAKDIVTYVNLYKKDIRDVKDPYMAPLLVEDATRQPATLLITAQHDPLRDEGEAYGYKLKEAGNYAEIHRIDTVHGFFNYSLFPKANKKAYTYIKHFLKGDAFNEQKRQK
ncbi:MAG: alpha/beta hydrolase [Bacilli bacterium]|nr:alpha/beta hydrolase [Bacilli bacterium]